MVRMSFQKPFEEWTASWENHIVNFDALIFTSQGDISEVTVTSQFSKRCLDDILEIIPFQTKLLTCHDGCLNSTIFFKLLQSKSSFSMDVCDAFLCLLSVCLSIRRLLASVFEASGSWANVHQFAFRPLDLLSVRRLSDVCPWLRLLSLGTYLHFFPFNLEFFLTLQEI